MAATGRREWRPLRPGHWSPINKELDMRMNRSRITLTLVVAFGLATALAACASGGGSGGPRRDPNLITAEELAEYTTLSALDVIRRLRPRWLQSRGNNTAQVIQDGARLGDPENALRSIPVSDIAELKYLSASDATMRYGTNYPGGAIEITSRGR